MRKLILALAAAGLMVVTVPTVLAAGGPRLAGKFKVVGTIHANDFGIPDGTTTPDEFKFTAKCPAPRACAKIKLDRDGGNHSHYKSTLRKVKPGVYKGTEGPYPYSCIDNNAATFTAKHTIKVTKAKSGKATAIGGSTKITIANCDAASFVNYTLKGTID
ncbi:MAG: hypothetical protein QOH90_2180 [Actinomycetota bacterium]|nr:hypothetical protein [Actinomycetota bacterium]